METRREDNEAGPVGIEGVFCCDLNALRIARAPPLSRVARRNASWPHLRETPLEGHAHRCTHLYIYVTRCVSRHGERRNTACSSSSSSLKIKQSLQQQLQQQQQARTHARTQLVHSTPITLN